MKKYTKILITGIIGGSLISGCGILGAGHSGINQEKHKDGAEHNSSGEMSHNGEHQKHHGKLESQTTGQKIASFGNYKKMIHSKNTEGVVNLNAAIPALNSYAVGAIQQGLGEITIIDGKVWLDYGKDGIGNSLNSIPADEKAVLLATSQVEEWQSSKIEQALSQAELFQVILEKAEEIGMNKNEPFPFLLEGNFNDLIIHVINGENPNFDGHGGKAKLLKQTKEDRKNQNATIIGFYSANNQGVYTHPGESWHLHAVLVDENIGAHVDGISTNKNVVLKLPSQL